MRRSLVVRAKWAAFFAVTLGAACAKGTSLDDGVGGSDDGSSTSGGATTGASSSTGPGDQDGDGFIDPMDDCPSVPNPDQANSDGDAMGDACDPDDDNDGIPDTDDDCHFVPDPMQADDDMDGIGNLCDNCTGVVNVDQTDSDGDKVGDVCDTEIIDDGTHLVIPAGATTTMHGSHCYAGNIDVHGTITVSPYDGTATSGILVLEGAIVTIGATGVIDGTAAGYQGGLPSTGGGGHQGSGPGLGCAGGPGLCVAQAGTGASYGGAGNKPSASNPYASACGTCDLPTAAHCEGAAGPLYGTTSGPDFDRGSGGGSGGNECNLMNTGGRGGAGGAAIVVSGLTSLTIEGQIIADGEKPPIDMSGSYEPGGGGGSGGAIVVVSPMMSGVGLLRAMGGQGGDSDGRDDDWAWGGGGGGGGRVKLFGASTQTFTGMKLVSGGSGGVNLIAGTHCFPGEGGNSGQIGSSPTIPPVLQGLCN